MVGVGGSHDPNGTVRIYILKFGESNDIEQYDIVFYLCVRS